MVDRDGTTPGIRELKAGRARGALADRIFEPRSGTDRQPGRDWLRLADPSRPEVILAIAALLATSELFFNLIWHSQYSWAPGLVLWPLTYLLVGIVLCGRYGLSWIFWSLRHLPLLCLVLAVALASAIWSPDPWQSFHGAAGLIGSTMIGLFVGYRFTPRETMQILAVLFTAIVVINLVVIVAVPGYGVLNYSKGYLPWAWTGATLNKNDLGSLAAVSALLFIAGTVTQRMSLPIGLGLIGLALLLLVMAQSATAVVGFVLGGAMIMLFYAGKRLRLPTLIVAFVLLAAAAAVIPFIMLDPGTVSEPLGRSSDLTNRTAIWRDARELIASRPLTGYGVDAIWGLDHQTWFPDLITTKWAQTGHNGYIQLAAELGLPTAAVALAFLLQMLWLALDQVRRRLSGFAIFTLAAMIAALTMNLAETRLFHRDDLIWVVFVALAAALVRLRAPPLLERAAADAVEPARARRTARADPGDPRRVRQAKRSSGRPPRAATFQPTRGHPPARGS